MNQVFSPMIRMLRPEERRRALLVFALTLLMAIVETLGVASIMPFIAVLANPEIVQENPYLAAAYDFVGFRELNHFLIALGTVTLVLLVSSALLRGATLWAQLRFTHLQSHYLGLRLVGGYLNQPYEWFLNQHSSRLSATVLAEVNNVVQGGYFTAMVLVSNIVVSTFLVTLLLIVDPMLAFSIAAALGATYGGLYLFSRKYLARWGKDRVLANRGRYKALAEGFGGIKDIKIRGLEHEFVGRFREHSLSMAKRTISTMIVSEMPSYVMQAVIFGGVVVLLLYMMGQYGGVEGALPVIALFALAGYRLLPAFQGIYRGLAQLRAVAPATEGLHKDLEAIRGNMGSRAESPSDVVTGRIPLNREIRFDNVTYRYPGADSAILDRLDLRIEARRVVGVVGPTGAGKTTLVDLILGLLLPVSGTIEVDGTPVSARNITAWQQSIGYVPQVIFLSDDTMAANIAFGVAPDRIDMAAVERAARIANLHEFITNELPLGYETEVGERGVRLSGGQRQRVGIARALYHDPDVLIFDEATSALDNVTERAVMEAIKELENDKTIVIVAHRLSTVRRCHKIIMMEKGRVSAEGTFDELEAECPTFRSMLSSTSDVPQRRLA